MFIALFTYQQVSQFESIHLLTIFICILCFFLIPYFGKKLTSDKQRTVSILLAIIGISEEILDYSNRIYFRDLNWHEDLPLHICNYVFYIGIYDLSASLGLPGEVENPKVLSQLEKMAKKINQKGKIIGTYTDTSEQAIRMKNLGINFLTCQADGCLIRESYENLLLKIKHE